MSRPLRQLGSFARVGVLVTASLLGGCVTTYQPLSSLQRPVVIDTKVANFEGLNLLVRCVPNESVNLSDSQTLCRQVSNAFRSQGAEVEIDVPRNGRSLRDEKAEAPDLVLELSARKLNEKGHNALSILLCFSTATLYPSSSELTYAQDVSVRDATGFLLASDSLQARFIESFGLGVWATHWVLDLAVRSDEEDRTGDAPNREFSRDFYGQLSQLVLNAQVRSVVLRGFEADIVPAPASATKGAE